MNAQRHVPVPAGAVVVLCGAPGSGKSTFAATNFAADEILSSDATRLLLTGSEDTVHADDEVFALLARELGARLRQGRVTVVDACNVDPAARAFWLRVARRAGAPAIALSIDPGLRQCLENNRSRRRVVPEPTLRDFHARLLATPPRADEGFVACHSVGDGRSSRITLRRAARDGHRETPAPTKSADVQLVRERRPDVSG